MIHQINKEVDSMIDIHVPNKQKDKLTKLMNNDKNSHTIKQTKKNRQIEIIIIIKTDRNI